MNECQRVICTLKSAVNVNGIIVKVVFEILLLSPTMKVVENDLRVVTKGRREVENQAQKMLAQGMETQVRFILFVFILDGILFLYFYTVSNYLL